MRYEVASLTPPVARENGAGAVLGVLAVTAVVAGGAYYWFTRMRVDPGTAATEWAKKQSWYKGQAIEVTSVVPVPAGTSVLHTERGPTPVTSADSQVGLRIGGEGMMVIVKSDGTVIFGSD